jgi:hypothetical protein
VPGTLPGYLGVAAFAGVKFVGYSLAVSGVKHFEPTLVAAATKVAAVRTGSGFVLGPPATLLGAYLTGARLFHSGYSPSQNAAVYGVLFIARIFVWALVLHLFTKNAPLPRSSFWPYAFLGAIVSSLLEGPGYRLAIAAPGQFVFC